MSKDEGSGAGGGLLSKMVKFVTSPTTDWSDLERNEESSAESESRLALKELMERKRQYEFVRNREFDMLRKLRRHGQGKSSRREPGAPVSAFPSSQGGLDTEDRERTLKKIDEIEEQMAISWFKRSPGAFDRNKAAAAQPRHAPNPAESPAAPAPQTPFAATEPLSPAFAPTVGPGPAGGIELDPLHGQAADAPSAPLAPAASGVPAAPAASVRAPLDLHAPAPVPAPARVTAPAPMPAPAPVSAPAPAAFVFNGFEDFNVEVSVKARHAPEIEEAAILFANGDAEGAAASLNALLADGSPLQAEQETWLTLFDLYRAMGEQTRFDGMAAAFAARFGRSAPQWGVVSQAAALAPDLPQHAPQVQHSTQFAWTCPSTLGTQTVATLNASVARARAGSGVWSANWRNLKTIDPAALPALADTLTRWGDEKIRFKFLGADKLLRLLADQTPTEDRSVDQAWWRARLGLLRVLGDMDEFDLAALNYCVTYEVSPPAWQAPVSSCDTAAEDGSTLIPTEAETGHPTVGGFQPTTVQPEEDSGTLHADLEGDLLGSADEALRHCQPGPHTTGFEINCRRLRRADFAAAGDLLNWAVAQRDEGRWVSFRQVNRMVAAFFGVVGLSDAARVELRTD